VEKVERKFFLMEAKSLNLRKENLNTEIDISVLIPLLAKKLSGKTKKLFGA